MCNQQPSSFYLRTIDLTSFLRVSKCSGNVPIPLKKEILVEEEVVDQFVDDTLIREVSAGGRSLESKLIQSSPEQVTCGGHRRRAIVSFHLYCR